MDRIKAACGAYTFQAVLLVELQQQQLQELRLQQLKQLPHADTYAESGNSIAYHQLVPDDEQFLPNDRFRQDV